MATLSTSRNTSRITDDDSLMASPAELRQIALAGNPNAGKTTLFNALTGMRQKVGNYPGVTVEKKEGRCVLSDKSEITILDLPGTYSLSPKSPDEEIARDVLLGLRADTPVPSAVVVVVDASNLERNLYLATQVLELGIPTIVALNMSDVARANGKPVDAEKLSRELGAPVVETVASRGEGLDALRKMLAQKIATPQFAGIALPEKSENARLELAKTLENALFLEKRALDLPLSASQNAPQTNPIPANRVLDSATNVIVDSITKSALSPDNLAKNDAPKSANFVANAPTNASANVANTETATPNSVEANVSLRARGIALRLLCGNVPNELLRHGFGPIVAEATDEARAQCEVSSARLGALEAQARYGALGKIAANVVLRPDTEQSRSFSDKLDAILTHKIWGLAIFALITLLVFQAIFSWASYPMDWIGNATTALGTFVGSHLGAGPLRDLLVQGVIAGVGAVLVFLPQILILFFFIGLLEDTGYMARAAFLMDRAMSRVGLHGRAFIPLMSSFACAIPGIMAARTISSRRDRMTTILIAPLMTCSARLPVYTLMIATFIPQQALWGARIGGKFFGLTLPAALMFGLYLLGMLAAMAAAWVFKRTLFKGPPPPLMMELPPYKIPAWRNIIVTMWDRASMFIKRAGTVILAISIVLWFLLSYPKLGSSQQAEAVRDFVPAQGIKPGNAVNRVLDTAQSSAQNADLEAQKSEMLAALQLRNSFAGRLGRVVEPAIAPLGFNWKIGIGLIGAMSAREVFVSTMGTVYSVGDADETSKSLKSAMYRDRWPDGRHVWTPLVAVSLLIYFVLAMQCLSTLAVVRRETNSWKWPLFMQFYMTALAWCASFGVYQIGRFFGWG